MLANDLLGQAKFRNAVNQHAAEFVQRLEHANFVSLLHQISGDGQSGWPAADDGYFLSQTAATWEDGDSHALFIVGDKTLQISDAQRLHFLAHQARAFAVVFLRTDAAGDGGKDVVFANLRGGAQKIARHNQLDKFATLSRPQDN